MEYVAYYREQEHPLFKRLIEQEVEHENVEVRDLPLSLLTSPSSSAHPERIPRASIVSEESGSLASTMMKPHSIGDEIIPSRWMTGLIPSNPSSTEQPRRNTNVSSSFELDLARVASGEEQRTTLMIRNIPNKYTQVCRDHLTIHMGIWIE